MRYLPPKGLFVLNVVLEVALKGTEAPLSKGSLEKRMRLPGRHLESVMRALVDKGILKGVRGGRGGYELARAPQLITTYDILMAVNSIEGMGSPDLGKRYSELVGKVVLPAIAKAEQAFAAELNRITLKDLIQISSHKPQHSRSSARSGRRAR